jgi:hypothetical protein
MSSAQRLLPEEVQDTHREVFQDFKPDRFCGKRLAEMMRFVCRHRHIFVRPSPSKKSSKFHT